MEIQQSLLNQKKLTFTIPKIKCLLLCILAIVAYFYGYLTKNVQIERIFKPLPVFFIMLLCIKECRADVVHNLFIIGFLAGAFGDEFLALDGELMFQIGAVCFLVQHILNITAFLKLQKFWTENSLWLLFMALLIAAAFLASLLPEVEQEEMKILLFAYCAVGLFAGWRAAVLLWDDNTKESTQVKLYAFLGYVIFMGSDFIVGLETFNKKIKAPKFVILGTYWLAQICFASFIIKRSQEMEVDEKQSSQLNDKKKK